MTIKTLKKKVNILVKNKLKNKYRLNKYKKRGGVKKNKNIEKDDDYEIDDDDYETDETDETDEEIDYNIEDDDILKDKNELYINKLKYDNERKENKELKKVKNNELYPLINDPNFNYKISEKIEFYNTQYEGEIGDIKKEAEKWCKKGFNIMPHQHFVKNFISKQTPYNSLILYFGLGSGKTCAAIGISELTRKYMILNSFDNPIMVIAKPSIQENFKKELFDKNKLYRINGKGERVNDNVYNSMWNIESCVGNILLNEINSESLLKMSRENINEYMTRLIKKYYVFYGYDKLKNYIINNIYKIIKEEEKKKKTKEEIKQIEIYLIQKLFNNRLLIIDEVHNIRLSDASSKSEGTKTSDMLLKIVKYSENMKLLLLSATPMYNNVEEIIWLTNLVNLNDNRSLIKIGDVFDKSSGKLVEKNGKKESGDELLKRKLIGYVSFIRGENPFIFPYRIYPMSFLTEIDEMKKTLKNIKYPEKMITGKNIKPNDRIKYIDIYINNCGSYQKKGYNLSIANLLDNKEIGSNYSYKYIQKPLQCLNIVYPTEELDNYNKNNKGITVNIEDIVGDNGLRNVIKYKKILSSGLNTSTGKNEVKKDFEYLKNVEHIFKLENLGKYSAKMFNISNIIKKSEGIIMIYSQYLESGIIPMSLALEEMGFTRYNYHNLFKNPPIESNGLHYTIICGISGYSPEKLLVDTMKTINSEQNKNGEKIKIILITKAGSEGLDFANIRQVHILDSWFNMSRIEQIIGRAVRTKSHCMLPFEKRCVEIYMHTTYEPNEREFIDMYLYRYSEKKAIKMGEITRILKEISVDCLLNIKQTNFTVDKLLDIIENKNIKLQLSSNPDKMINFKIGDKPYSSICDYMENCNYKCKGNHILPNKNKLDYNTYSIDNLKTNYEKISKRIKELFREENKYFYKKRDLIDLIQVKEQYEIEEIFYVLNEFINKHQILIDEYGNSRYLIQKGNYYLTTNIELGYNNDNTENITLFDITHPIKYKNDSYKINVDEIYNINSTTTDKKSKDKKTLLKEIIKKLEQNIKDTFLSKNEPLEYGNKNWYKLLSYGLNLLKSYIPIITDDLIKKYVIENTIDLMTYEEQYLLIEAIYNKEDNSPLTEIIKNSDIKVNIVNYFNSIKLISKQTNDEYIILISPENSESRWTILSLNENDFLDEIEGFKAQIILDDIPTFKKQNNFFILKNGNFILKDIKDIYVYITFILNGEFKQKDLQNYRTIKADGANLKNIKIEEIIKNIENYIKIIYPNKNFDIKNNDFKKLTLISIFEIITRFYTDKQINNKIYYLKPIEYIFTYKINI